MKANENIKVTGVYHVEGFNIITGEKVFDETYRNVITQLYFDSLFSFMDSSGTDGTEIGLTFFSTGDDDTTALKADTELGNEIFRKSLTSVTSTSNKVIATTVLAPAESVFVIKELGIWAEGSLTLDSGTLISHVNVDIDKNISTQYNITYTFTIE